MTTQYVLYVAGDKRDNTRFCVGSTLCLSIMEYLPQGMVEVRNCDEMKKARVASPTWLIGTPTLVSSTGSDIYRGQQALMQLQDVTVYYTEQRAAATVVRKPPPTEGAAASARRGEVGPSRHRHHQPPPPGRGPEDPRSGQGREGEEDAELSNLWDSKVNDEDDTDDALGGGKLTGDDLAKAVSQRQQTIRQPSQSGPPPPPPPQEKD